VKESRYNFWLEDPYDSTGKLCFNAVSCGFARFDEETINLLKRISDRSIDESLLSEDEANIINDLKNSSYLVPDDWDYITQCKFDYLKYSFQHHWLAMTILPTMQCNLRCTYCFEEHKDIRMTDNVAKSIKKYASDYVKKNNPGGIHIAWYGGEPLLELDRVLEITEYCRSIAKDNKITFSSEMISNCVLLTEDVANKLINAGVGRIQVTLDGDKNLHDKKRKYSNNKGTFDTIMDNILKAPEQIHFAIRVNIDNELYKTLPKFFNDITPLSGKKNFGIYPALLRHDVTSTCSSIKSSCLDLDDFASVSTEFYERLLDNGHSFSWYPKPTIGGCGATSLSSVVIEPNGNLCRCWSQVGCEGESYGNILNLKETFKHEPYYKWFMFDPTADEICRDCKYFPLCKRGCPAKHVKPSTEYTKPTYSDKRHCTLLKQTLDDLLQIVYRLKKKELDVDRENVV